MKANEEKAMLRVEQRQENLPMPINSLEEVQKLGDMFEKSGMFGCSQQGQGAVLVLTCKMANMTPLDYIRTFHLIEGKPSMRADAMLAKFAERGGKYKVVEFSAKRAAASFTKGENTLDLEITMEQALAAEWPKDSKGQLKKNWRCTPDAMLWARLVSKAIRILDPGVNAGTYTPEEVADFESERNVTREVSSGPAMTAATTTATTTTQPAPEVVTPEVVPVDFSVMPMKTAKYPVGTKFSDMDKDTLGKVLKLAESKQYPDLTAGHAAVIKAVLEGAK